ncbi:rRNA pseudouridine synthase [Treponema sp. OMZ 840]|uniref:pseudouridine synthase n=1 Tax=Treponema sp. OMZ 840 TaxID=244313 RepID=UPI003D930AAE
MNADKDLQKNKTSRASGAPGVSENLASGTIRLDKLLARQGFGTRSGVKKLVRAGRVEVNGTPCIAADMHIRPVTDTVCVDGKKIELKSNLYLMINKPKNTVCSAKDPVYTTVFDLLDKDLCRRFFGGDLHVAGRLDADTEGFVLCTTDGELTHRIISPKKHIAKTYFVCLKNMPEEPRDKAFYVNLFKDGMDIPAEGAEKAFRASSSILEWLGEKQSVRFFADEKQAAEYKGCAACTLTVFEGKYHQVKRMFRAAGNEVVFLKRIAIGSLMLDFSLKSGGFRELSGEEIARLESAEKPIVF